MKPEHRFWLGSLVVAALVLGLVAPLGQASLAAGATIYVDADASGDGDGTSWADAFTNLQAALDIVASGDQIWVAEGIYKPTVEYGGTGDRYQSFQMKNGVAIYGGFDPSVEDIAWGDRDWKANQTTLSGDLNGDDEPNFTNYTENSYHVFYHPAELALDSSAILDGFTISSGNANSGALPHYSGAGMYNATGSPTLTNVVFTSHNASSMGGAIYNFAGSGPLLTDVSFSSNHAQAGGGMFNDTSNPLLVRVSFADNSADNMGGGMHNMNSRPTLTDATFTNNGAMYGGGIYNYGSNLSLTGVTFSANDATLGGGMYNNTSQPTLMKVNFSENLAADGGGMLNIYSSDPVLTNVTFYGNQADKGGGMFNSQDSNPTLVNSVFSRNWATEGGGIYNEYDSGPRLTNVTFAGNDAAMAGGMYNYESDPILNNAIFWDIPTIEIYSDIDTKLTIYNSDIKGGCPTGAICDQVINLDPQFIRIPSPVWGSGEVDNGDLRLQLTSPAIDAGTNVAVPAGITTDLLGLPRFVDILSVLDTGLGTPPIVDMGAYEVQVVIFLPIVRK